MGCTHAKFTMFFTSLYNYRITLHPAVLVQVFTPDVWGLHLIKTLTFCDYTRMYT